MNPTNDNGAHSFTEGATFEIAENINEFLKEDKTMQAIYLLSSLQFGETLKSVSDFDYRRFRYNYDALLKQPLQLCFFVPCDENGNVLEEPKRWNDYLQFPDSFDGNKEWGELYNYELAKERVLFKGFEARMFGWKKLYYVKLGDNKNSIYTFPNLRNYTIKNLVRLEVELTENAIKQIGL